VNEGKKAAPDEDGFPIVGIGASAGGLEALSQFFDAMPPNRKIAFVVVTHQHAGHVSLLPELRKHRAIAIVLSGAGSDGTLGVKAIKSEGGMVMAQDPETAKHSSMPCSAVATGVVDFVLPVDSMPKKLLEYATAPVVAPASKTLLPARPALDDGLSHLLRGHESA
jgi:chemotaxis response regulator CheB